MQANDPSMNDVPRINEVRRALADTEIALRNGTPLPPEVHLVVTNEGGRATGVTPACRPGRRVPRHPDPAAGAAAASARGTAAGPDRRLPRVAPPPPRDDQG